MKVLLRNLTSKGLLERKSLLIIIYLQTVLLHSKEVTIAYLAFIQFLCNLWLNCFYRILSHLRK